LHCKAADFDLDGDVDIVATSFFPGDRTNNFAPFKYFEQDGGKFKAKTFKGSKQGKWMELVTGDFDTDGRSGYSFGFFSSKYLFSGGTKEELINTVWFY
jgi:hypothetical protein